MSFSTARKPAPTHKPDVPKTLLGGEVTARCRKCKAVTKHVVLAKVGVKPTRVQCCTCNGEHPYSPPVARRSAALAPQSLSWPEAMVRASGAATAYVAVERYAVGTRLSHASFGEGVVVRLASPTVCEVLFESRTIKLVMAAPSSRFVAPEPTASSRPRRRLR